MVGFSCLETGELGSYDGYKAVKCGHVRSAQCACFCICPALIIAVTTEYFDKIHNNGNSEKRQYLIL